MYHHKSKSVILSILAAAMIVPVAAETAVPLKASAAQLLMEGEFDYKIAPWHVTENSPAKQRFDIDDGALHLTVLSPTGRERGYWDLGIEYGGLDFKKGSVYHFSFKVKASRDGMELMSHLTNSQFDYYFELDGKTNDMHNGPAEPDGHWGSPVKLTTEYQTFEGDFTPHEDLEGLSWVLQYANDENGHGGNAIAGDELWFDDMQITDEDCRLLPPLCAFYTTRDTSSYETGVQNNYISVNQLGYYPGLAKIATLGDNKGDFLPGANNITLDKAAYTWELVEDKSGKVVKTGTTGKPFNDKDSGDRVCKIDFSDYNKEGTYYLRIKDTEWRSFPFRIGSDIYEQTDHNLLTDALNYFYQNRAGSPIYSKYITSKDQYLAHDAGHKSESAFVQTRWRLDYADREEAEETYASSELGVNGGWYDAEIFSKNLVSGGIAVWTLQNMYERALYTLGGKEKFADGSGTCVVPETGNKIPDVLDECKYELDYMQKMKVQENEPTWGQYAGMYFHNVMDHKWTGLAIRPWDYEGPADQGGWNTVRIAKPPTFAATLNYAACAAQAARLWKPYDAEYAAELLQSAKDAYAAFRKNYYEPDNKSAIDPNTGLECTKEELNEASLYAPINTTRYSYIYGDLDVTDDAYWAACELYLSASEMSDADAEQYLKYLSDYKDAFKTATRISGGANADDLEGSYSDFNWGNTATAGTFSLLLRRDLLDEKASQTLHDSLLAAADSFLKTEDMQGYGIPYLFDGPGYAEPSSMDPSIRIDIGFETGSNAYALNNMIAMAYAYDLTGDIKYLDGVAVGMDYLLGNNPLAFSYITGYGSYCAVNPTHNYWAHSIDKTLPQAPDGVISAGPSTRLYDNYVRTLGFVLGKKDNVSERCYVDDIEAWSVNTAALEYNAPLAWVVSFMQDQGKKVTGVHSVGGTQPGETTETTAETTTTSSDSTTTTAETTTASVSTVAAPADPGNVNGDDTVDISDAVLLARFVAEDTEANLTADGKQNADVNRNGKPDSDDVILILKYIAKLIEKF